MVALLVQKGLERMKVFISWSGETGRAFAKVLHSWLPSVLQAVKPFFSSDDIAKGVRWSSEVGTELENSHVGIVVVTRESLSAPWVMFEAGALSKNVGRSRVVPILVDLEPADVRGPLMQFQCAKFDAVEIKRMLRMLNSELKDFSVTDDVLESAFAMWWPKLEKEVAQLLRDSNVKLSAVLASDRDLLEEIVRLSRSIARQQAKSLRPSPTSHQPIDAEWSAFEDNTGVESGALTLESVQKRMRSGGNLAGANLMKLNLVGLDLSGANLRGANLVGANLSGASLVGTDLDAANLESARMDGADLKGAIISRANLWHASMREVRNLSLVKSMDEANFFKVDLNDSDRSIVAAHSTLSISSYPKLFAHYRKSGMKEAELRDLFLWTSHSYPGADF